MKSKTAKPARRRPKTPIGDRLRAALEGRRSLLAIDSAKLSGWAVFGKFTGIDAEGPGRWFLSLSGTAANAAERKAVVPIPEPELAIVGEDWMGHPLVLKSLCESRGRWLGHFEQRLGELTTCFFLPSEWRKHFWGKVGRKTSEEWKAMAFVKVFDLLRLPAERFVGLQPDEAEAILQGIFAIEAAGGRFQP